MSHGPFGQLFPGDSLEITLRPSLRIVETFVATEYTTFCKACGKHWPQGTPPPKGCGLVVCYNCGLPSSQHIDGKCLFEPTYFRIDL